MGKSPERRAEARGKAGHRFDVGFDVPTRHRVQRHDGRSLPSALISSTLQHPYPLGRYYLPLEMPTASMYHQRGIDESSNCRGYCCSFESHVHVTGVMAERTGEEGRAGVATRYLLFYSFGDAFINQPRRYVCPSFCIFHRASNARRAAR